MESAWIDWKLVATVGLQAVLVIAGWFLVHLLTARRDLVQRRREARQKSLETAYLRLANSAQRSLTDEMMDEIELFVSELQLYGTPQQVEMMGRVVEGLKMPNNPVDFTPLLIDLRDTIRAQLKLEPLGANVWWFRFNRIAKKERFRIRGFKEKS